MIAPKRRLTNHALHGREEWFKRIFRDQIAEAAGILEVVLSGIVLAALLMSRAASTMPESTTSRMPAASAIWSRKMRLNHSSLPCRA